MNDAKPQIVEKLKSANNILVAVSADPTVDQLTAAIALTLLINKLKKNATAVFSGKIPHVIDFLKPKDTIQNTTDSLRDFIISLDKSKADKLRYKVEDDVVKIFITPYRASITENDLKYSAGDFNVDLILAVGVKHQQDLDVAITAHGRIFHDAVVMSINNAPGGDFGVANWEDLTASSLSEQIANLAVDLGPNLLDEPIATALLTGIVAETSRFSNDKTHPKTMTVSSLLLEAGANQQLVNYQLQDIIGTVVTLAAGTEIAPTKKFDPSTDSASIEEELIIDENGSFAPKKPAAQAAPIAPVTAPDPIELPTVSAVPAELAASPTPSVESLLGGAQVESTPTPFLDSPNMLTQPDDAQNKTDVDDGNATSARQAVEDALSAHSSESPEPLPAPEIPQVQPIEPPAIDNLPDFSDQQLDGFLAPQPQPDQQPERPIIQPIMPNQPSYDSPNSTTQYSMPPIPEHEPAPLGMSPADQPFTMPLPPSNSMTAPVGTSFESAMTSGSQPTNVGTIPPPLPPPMPQQGFSGPRR